MFDLQSEFRMVQGDCLQLLTKLPDQSIDFIFGSPPYAEKGERYLGGRKKWRTEDWVEWMLAVTMQSVRVTKGYVMWVANGSVRGGRYLPACEGLVWMAYKSGIRCERPSIWHKNAPPNRRDYLGNDWEYVLAFKTDDGTPYFDWESIAEKPKYNAGGRFRQRTATGERRLGSEYPQSALARPRDVVRVTVGGGHLGSKLAHLNEAPFPYALAERYIVPFCPPGGLVLDPFSGSGTSGDVCVKTGRRYLGFDVRESQIELSTRRYKEAKDAIRKNGSES